MSQQPIANREQQIAKLALGTVQFGMDYGISNTVGQTTKKEVAAILNLAKCTGVNTLDTAQGYGESEEVLGEVGVTDFNVISKLCPTALKKNLASFIVEQSLKATGLTKLYGMLFHNAESAMNYPAAVHELQASKEEGVILKWGYSVYTTQELEQLLNRYDLPDLIQVPYNHLDNRFEPLMKELHQKGVEIHTRSTFLQGLFFMDPDNLPEFFNLVKEYLTNLRKGYGNTERIASNLLGWVLEKSFIDRVVIGVNSKDQLLSNILGLDDVNLELLPKRCEVANELLMPNLWPKN